MPYWEVILDKDKEILGRYNQEYFTEQKIGEIVKKLYEPVSYTHLTLPTKA